MALTGAEALGDLTGCLAADRGWHGAPLDTARLRLRRMRSDDAPEIARLLDDWEVARTTSNIPFPYERSIADDFIAKVTSEVAEGRALVFAIEERLTGKLVGCVGASINSHSAEIGYWIGQEFWNKGYATEAMRRCLRALFVNFGLGTVWGAVLPENPASRRVMEKAGLAFERVQRMDMPARNRCTELEVFTISREQWQEAQAAKPMLLVVAVALIDLEGRVLIAQRPKGKSMAGFWEFPGGKLDAGETPEAALVRELHEELGIDVGQSCLSPLAFASHDYDSFHLLMPLYACRQWIGQPEPREGQTLAWVRAPRLGDYPMPPADIPLVAILRDWL
jgi:8-oxo-dGTP diphosphatase